MKNEIFLIDDHRMMMIGLKHWIEEKSLWKVTGIFDNGQELLSELNKIKIENPDNIPEIIIFDIELSDGKCFDLIKTVSQDFPEIKNIVYSMYDSAGYVLMAQTLGCKAYLSKAEKETELLRVIDLVNDGEQYFDSNRADQIKKIKELSAFFTKTEETVFNYVLTGCSNAEIAQIMNIKIHSVENFVSLIYEKAGVKNRKELLERYC